DLDDVGGGGLDGAGADGEAIEAEGVVGHPIGVLAEVAALTAEGLAGGGRWRGECRECGEDWFWAGHRERVTDAREPGAGVGRVAEGGLRGGCQVLAG